MGRSQTHRAFSLLPHGILAPVVLMQQECFIFILSPFFINKNMYPLHPSKRKFVLEFLEQMNREGSQVFLFQMHEYSAYFYL